MRVAPTDTRNKKAIMKAELKQILETDHWEDLKDYCPENPNYFYVQINMSIGILGEKGADYFYTAVCSFDYFKRLKGKAKNYHQRELIVIESYDYQDIMERIHSIISKYDEPDWVSLAQQLNKYFLWEYDNYQ